MALLRRDRAPPPHYYAARIHDLLDGTERQYSDLLNDEERAWMHGYRTLDAAAQRLLARLVGRRGPLLRVDSLVYREVGAIEPALAALGDAGFIARDPEDPGDRFLNALTIPELCALFPFCARTKKPALVDRIAARYPDPTVRARVTERHPMVAVAHRDVIDRLQALFFGGDGDLSTFVLQDLGIVRFEAYPLPVDARLFANRADFERHMELGALRDEVGTLDTAWDPRRACEFVACLSAQEASRTLERRRGRLLNRIGAAAERAGEHALALDCYAASPQPPARERRVRILARQGNAAAAEAVLHEMCAAPRAPTEAQFARAFAGVRMRSLPAPPESRLRLPSAPSGRVEDAALTALLDADGAGRHLENLLPLTLTGLAFWDIVFAPVPGAFSHAFQDRPLDLYWDDFRTTRAAAIASRLAELRDADALGRRILGTYESKRGVANALVSWDAVDAPFLDCVTRSVPSAVWCAIFDHLLDDLENNRRGFPDLAIVYAPARFEFVEVKGPGDQLRREQRVWFDFFARERIPARVLRVEW